MQPTEPNPFEKMHERTLKELVLDAILDLPEFGERWFAAPGDPSDNRDLVADSIATHVRQEFGREPSLEEVRGVLEATSESDIRTMMRGPPWQ